jgi:predicted xylose isomerase-like sugar epimerase
MASKKILLIGHGKAYQVMRCCPIPLEEFVKIVSNCQITMVDMCQDVLPDVVCDVTAANWEKHLADKYDIVIECVSHLARIRKSKHYWEGLSRIMSHDAQYIGWADFRGTIRTNIEGVTEMISSCTIL